MKVPPTGEGIMVQGILGPDCLKRLLDNPVNV